MKNLVLTEVRQDREAARKLRRHHAQQYPRQQLSDKRRLSQPFRGFSSKPCGQEKYQQDIEDLHD